MKPAKQKTRNFIHNAPEALLRSSKNVPQVTHTARPRHFVQEHHESKRPQTAIPILGDDIVGNAQQDSRPFQLITRHPKILLDPIRFPLVKIESYVDINVATLVRRKCTQPASTIANVPTHNHVQRLRATIAPQARQPQKQKNEFFRILHR
jgi:hypothetical protein